MSQSTHPTRSGTVNKHLAVEHNAGNMRFAKNIFGTKANMVRVSSGSEASADGRIIFLRITAYRIAAFNSGFGVAFLNFRILHFWRLCQIDRSLYPDADASILRWALTKKERDEYARLDVLENQMAEQERCRLLKKAGTWPDRPPARNFGVDFAPCICPF